MKRHKRLGKLGPLIWYQREREKWLETWWWRKCLFFCLGDGREWVFTSCVCYYKKAVAIITLLTTSATQKKPTNCYAAGCILAVCCGGSKYIMPFFNLKSHNTALYKLHYSRLAYGIYTKTYNEKIIIFSAATRFKEASFLCFFKLTITSTLGMHLSSI